jgi:transcriptional regulator with XRE-family HTH domain
VRSETVKKIESKPQTAWQERETTPFCDWLDTRLRGARMSQRQLAMRAGVHHSTISRLVRYRRTPSFATAVRLARVLDPTGSTPIASAQDAHASSPPMRVEHALRSDPSLAASDVRDLMRRYLRLRAHRGRSVGSRQAPRAELRRVRAGPA